MCRGTLDTIQSGTVTSASLLGAVIGSAIAIFLRDKVGRKFELLLAAACYGAVSYPAPMLGFSPFLTWVLCASSQGLAKAEELCLFLPVACAPAMHAR